MQWVGRRRGAGSERRRSQSASSSAQETSADSGQAAPSPGKDYPVAAEGKAVPEDSLGTQEGMGFTFSLTTVKRISDDRVMVQGVLDGKDASPNRFGQLREDGYNDHRRNEFAAVTVMKKGDPTVYLPVRDADKRCLCTNIPVGEMRKKNAVQVLMSAPKGEDTLTITVQGIGTFPDVKVSS